jgi:hypothetical protein
MRDEHKRWRYVMKTRKKRAERVSGFYEEFSYPTRWSLYNSFTELAKKYTPPRADQAYRRLGKLFELN